MSASVLDLIVADHRRIRSLLGEIRKEMTNESALSEDACFNIFRTFKALVMAHAKAEEYALYALFDVDKKNPDQDMQNLALEGYEEHDLVDKILKEMGQAEEVSPQWRAQFKVACELLDRHTREEEQDFLPKVHSFFAEDELVELGELYMKERDQIFTKKSGLDIQAAGLFEPGAIPASFSRDSHLNPH